MKTRIHYYCFDITKSVDFEMYRKLCDAMKEAGRYALRLILDKALLNMLYDVSQVKGDRFIHLLTTEVHTNKWITMAGVVYDWVEVVHPNNKSKEGYYLEITDEMQLLRDNTYRCPCCGHQYRDNPYPYFCTQCIESETMQRDDLYKTFLRPVSLLDVPVITKNILLPTWVVDRWTATHSTRVYP